MNISGVDLPIIGLDEFRANKRASGRAKDLADLESLASAEVPVIAIDGPSASGKGTVASRVAAALGFHYLESGALYRLLALVGGDAPEQVAARIEIAFLNDKTFLDNQDVTDSLRGEAIGVKASEIAKLPAVRLALLERQHAFRQPPGLVADGRDMGTVVFPDAVLKVFLTASVAVRAQRRYKQLIDKGNHANLAALSRALEGRDQQDVAREVAPLKPAADAVSLDSSALTIDEVVDQVLRKYQERTSGKR
ncbi:MAG: (d)CMP kinase [Betaproteobacteria bacterium]|nr:(d)CMP kinase [Betaproteobacteria bacterium]